MPNFLPVSPSHLPPITDPPPTIKLN